MHHTASLNHVRTPISFFVLSLVYLWMYHGSVIYFTLRKPRSEPRL